MAAELDAQVVSARLAELRLLYKPELLEEAQRRLAEETPRRDEPLEVTAARGLAELRALWELARHLHRAKIPAVNSPDDAE